MTLARLTVIGVGLLAARAGGEEGRLLKSQRDRQSYAMAVALARTLQRQAVDVDVAVFSRGLGDALAGRELLLPEEELRGAMGALLAGLQQQQAISRKTVIDRKRAGEAFLTANAKEK
ncbi:MAG TPA: FKBP-type peptidyl-prolyl cis-trans isomerase N-terminal domain-containing protein, partial [Anaeromyxobacter sp.]